jgi:hypothetical protein
MIRHIANLIVLLMAFYTGVANAQQYMAHADFSACPSQYVSGSGQDGPFDSESECQSYIDSVNQLACAVYTCDPVGGGSSGGSESDSSSAPPTAQGLIHESTKNFVQGMMNGNGQQEGIGLMGITAGMLLQGSQSNPQQEAQQRAQEAARVAEEKRQAEERAKQRELIKEQLLGEAPSGGDSTGDLHLMGVTPEPNLQLMTGDQALAPMATSTSQPASNIAAKVKRKYPDAFNKGYQAASQCFSQNIGTACFNVVDPACAADYRAGFAVGTNEQKMKIDEAKKLGQLDAEDGKPDNSFNVTKDSYGDCMTDLNHAYENGYHQVRNAAATARSNK